MPSEEALQRRQARNKAWDARNPEKMRAYRRAWKKRNPEKVRAQNRKDLRKRSPEQKAASNKRYRLKHVEKLRAKKRAEYQANKVQHDAKTKAWVATHPKRRREIALAWVARNPERHKANVDRRRARLHSAPINDLTAAQWTEIKAAYGNTCVYCSRKMQRLEKDHITPLSKGGSHTASNIVPACRSCNSRKNAGAPLCPVQPLLLTIA